jgi:guanyl-specific ribonuclease Sa
LKALKFRISGNAPAQHYSNIYSRQNQEVVATGWIDSPPEEKEAMRTIQAGGVFGYRIDKGALRGSIGRHEYRHPLVHYGSLGAGLAARF